MAEAEQTVHDEYFLLWVLIAQTKDAILRARERDYARYGITNDRRAVLYAIQRNGGSAVRICAVCHVNGWHNLPMSYALMCWSRYRKPAVTFPRTWGRWNWRLRCTMCSIRRKTV